jgi:SAM-dependent methyltransferase
VSNDRLHRERDFYEKRSSLRGEALADETLYFEDSVYVDHESWVRDTFELLGDLQGKRVLDYGAGDGMSATVLARLKGDVFAFDIAFGNAVLSARRAYANGVGGRVHLQEMAGESLGYRDESFDAIYGNAVLHHVDLELAGKEMARVLRPGGIAVFSEPWGGNPILEFVRKRIPYRGKDRTEDEEPIRQKDIETLRKNFPWIEMRGYQLFSMIRRLFRWKVLIDLLEVIDRILLRVFPWLQRYCRYAVIVMRKGGPQAGEGMPITPPGAGKN